MAELEREQTSERTSQKAAWRAAKGLKNGGQILGYDVDPDNPGIPTVNDQERDLVLLIYQTYLETVSWCILDQLPTHFLFQSCTVIQLSVPSDHVSVFGHISQSASFCAHFQEFRFDRSPRGRPESLWNRFKTILLNVLMNLKKNPIEKYCFFLVEK